jgi:hypothetical protein
VFLCGPAQFLDWRAVTVWIGSSVDADVAVDLRTGTRVGLPLAAAVWQAKDSDEFEFLD